MTSLYSDGRRRPGFLRAVDEATLAFPCDDGTIDFDDPLLADFPAGDPALPSNP